MKIMAGMMIMMCWGCVCFREYFREYFLV